MAINALPPPPFSLAVALGNSSVYVGASVDQVTHPHRMISIISGGCTCTGIHHLHHHFHSISFSGRNHDDGSIDRSTLTIEEQRCYDRSNL